MKKKVNNDQKIFLIQVAEYLSIGLVWTLKNLGLVVSLDWICLIRFRPNSCRVRCNIDGPTFGPSLRCTGAKFTWACPAKLIIFGKLAIIKIFTQISIGSYQKINLIFSNYQGKKKKERKK